MPPLKPGVARLANRECLNHATSFGQIVMRANPAC